MHGSAEHKCPMLIYVYYVGMFILMLKHLFVESPNTINTCLILSTIYILIDVSSCVGSGPSALLFPGAYVAVKTALQRFIATFF